MLHKIMKTVLSLFVLFIVSIVCLAVGCFISEKWQISYVTKELPAVVDLVPTNIDKDSVTSGFLGKAVLELNGEGEVIAPDLDTKIKDSKQLNEDVVGWISIPELSVDYPVLYSESNHTYLRTGMNKEYDIRGCIYLDARCKNPYLTIKLIHGHNMADGTLFSRLPEMFNLGDLADAPVITYTNELGTKRFQPISIYSIDATKEGIFFDTWATIDDLTQLKAKFIERSFVPVSEVPSGVELLLLNTCWYGESGHERNLHCIIVATRIS